MSIFILPFGILIDRHNPMTNISLQKHLLFAKNIFIDLLIPF